MSENTSLIVSNAQQLPVFAFNDAAKELREVALTQAALIGKVENADQNALAVRAQMELKRVSQLFEKQRKAMKEPLLEAGRQLDRLVFSESVELDKELGRIQGLVSEFQLAEQRRVREEQRLQQEELARIEREKQAELKRIADAQAEVERKAREAQEAAARLAAEATNKKQREAAERARQEAEAKAKSAQEAAAAAQSAAAKVEEKAAEKTYVESRPVEATRVEGQRVSYDWKIEVTNPYELSRLHPDCVKIEPLLTPIKAALNQGRTIAGIRAEKIMVSGVRVKPGRAAITV